MLRTLTHTSAKHSSLDIFAIGSPYCEFISYKHINQTTLNCLYADPKISTPNIVNYHKNPLKLTSSSTLCNGVRTPSVLVCCKSSLILILMNILDAITLLATHSADKMYEYTNALIDYSHLNAKVSLKYPKVIHFCCDSNFSLILCTNTNSRNRTINSLDLATV